MTARFLLGDTRQVLKTLPDNSVDLVMTSPPFLALRSYLPADSEHKHLEMGSEPTPGEFIDGLLDVVVELRRVLAPHGSLCFELGDTYSGSGGAGGDYNDGGLRDGQQRFVGSARRDKLPIPRQNSGGSGWPLAKSLCLIPQTFAWALAYGCNPHTGRKIEPWRVRNIIRWCRPNPPVGALGDKFRPATSEITVACVSGSRYFDLDAVRAEPLHGYTSTRQAPNHREVPGQPINKCNPLDDDGHRIDCNPAGAPPLDFWVIPTSPYPGSHYATYPEALVVKPIKAMCPERVCLECGKPSERIVEAGYVEDRSGGGAATKRDGVEPEGNARGVHGGPRLAVANTTLGWTDCGHDAWRRGVVLDPFAGSGTTLAVAVGHGRDAVGIDLDARNLDLARQRLGMFLEEEEA